MCVYVCVFAMCRCVCMCACVQYMCARVYEEHEHVENAHADRDARPDEDPEVVLARRGAGRVGGAPAEDGEEEPRQPAHHVEDPG